MSLEILNIKAYSQYNLQWCIHIIVH